MLTLQDRLNEMRKTKINHTLEKKRQNGYTDLDDFGTVPLPEGYFVEPWYNSKNGSFYGYEGMCENFVRIMAAQPAYVDPMEMLCGRWRDMLVNYRGDLHYMPKWRQNDPRNRQYIEKGATNQWSKRWDEERFPYDELKSWQEKYNITSGIDGDAHLACDYTIGFQEGFGGLLKKIKKYRAMNPEKERFYLAEERTVLAIMDFIQRHIDRIKELIDQEKRPELKESLQEMLRVSVNIKEKAPSNFYEACQWTAYFNCASRIYTRDGAGFQMDVLLYPWYQRDIENGTLTKEKAKFLIANLLLIDPHYYQVSGVDEQDRDLTNELSWIILEAADAINVSCNLTVRVHPNCDRKFLEQAVHYLFKNKSGWPRFCNDLALTEGYMRTGASKTAARKRAAVGCNWFCIPGLEFPMNDTVKINVAKVFEQAWIEMRPQKEKSCTILFELYKAHLKKAVEVTAAGVNLHIDHQHEVTPELVMNLMMYGTIENGLDISQCAAYYTIGVDGAGLAVVADSFGALQDRIEEKHVLTWEDVYEAVGTDYSGISGERIRQILDTAPKYCQGNTVSDQWAVQLTKNFVETIRGQKMPKKRQLLPGWFSWSRTMEYGACVGATPNGRHAGAPISHGANPNPGFRKDGAVTAQSQGIASVQCGYGNAAPLQLEFDPLITEESGGVQRVVELIEGHFAQGGTLININILDGEKLLEANRDPEKYPDLVVRVTGFTAYFVSLSPKFRQLVVDRFLRGL